MKIIDINGKQRECVRAYPDPSYPGFIRVEYENPKRKYHVWIPVDDFEKNNPGVLGGVLDQIHHPPPEVTSTPTSATKSTLTDSTRQWEENTYRNSHVWIGRGKGEGQSREIIANTQDTLILKDNWDDLPDKSSQYVISEHIKPA